MIHTTDPLRDPRWVELLNRHPQASVFHTPQWLEALKRTYGYEPFVLTTSPPDQELRNGIVFCRVESWLTGRRLVSLPFSDHCQPLVDNEQDLLALLSFLRDRSKSEKWNYIELRPKAPLNAGLLIGVPLAQSKEYYLHTLDLRPSVDTIFRNFHKRSTQDKIRRAERQQLTYDEGRSDAILAKFYGLLLTTRRRHQLPPQPLEWFQNLVECFGERLKIRVVSKDGQPIAGTMTISYKQTLVYKYGGSDARYNLGGMPFVMWKAIQEGKEQGAEESDLGRSDADNPGLVDFKRHLGALCSTLTYYTYPPRAAANGALGWKTRIARNAFGWLPDSLLIAAGRLLYKHMG